MSTRCGLLLLPITLLAISYRAVGEADIIPYFRLPNNFTWTYVGPHNVTLCWDVQGLGEQFADQITVAAILDGFLGKNKTVDYKLGEVTLSGLKANSTYEVIVEAIKGGQITEYYFDEIDTLPEDQPEHEQTASSYTPRTDVFTYRGTEESVVRTTESTSSSAISGIVSACMVVMLAWAFVFA